MGNLTIGLAVLGGIVMAGIVAHGAWSARKSNTRLAKSKSKLNALDKISDAFVTTPQSAREEDIPNTAASPEIAQVLAQVDKRPVVDALIDAIAPISMAQPVYGEAAIAAFPTSWRCGSKPFSIEGLRVDNGEWELPHSGQQYSAFQVAVQLANRSGALNEIEFSEFVGKAQVFADKLDGDAEFPDMLFEVARGRELDQFASEHDVQMGFIIRPRETPWTLAHIHQVAQALGFVAGSLAGRLVLPASVPGQPPVLVLNMDAQTAMTENPNETFMRSIRLSLDAPQVDRNENAFVKLCEAASKMAQALDGVIVDEEGYAIRQEAVNAITQDLETFYQHLEQHDFAAGSVLARRLFN